MGDLLIIIGRGNVLRRMYYYDFVYWLNQHLISMFDITLDSLAKDISSIAHSDSYIWKWTADSMSLKFR